MNSISSDSRFKKNRLPRLLHRVARAIQLYQGGAGLSKAWFLSGFGLPPLSILDVINTGIRLKDAPSANLTDPQHHFVLAGLDFIRQLKNWESCSKFSWPESGVLAVEFKGIRMHCLTTEELFFIVEIFVEGIYNIVGADETVIIDVGANVGTASLYFAALPQVEKVYAYEIFPQTALLAQANLNRNPDLAAKIQLTALGLASHHGEYELDYDPKVKGHAGLFGILGTASDGRKDQKQSVEVIDVVEAITLARSEHPRSRLIVKLDCEGAEYSILERLKDSGAIHGIDGFVMEWHKKGAAPLKEILFNEGFGTYSSNSPLGTHGMVYAFRWDTSYSSKQI
jgi:FkbM family methyltransferase